MIPVKAVQEIKVVGRHNQSPVKLFHFVCHFAILLLSERIFKTASGGSKTAFFWCVICRSSNLLQVGLCNAHLYKGLWAKLGGFLPETFVNIRAIRCANKPFGAPKSQPLIIARWAGSAIFGGSQINILLTLKGLDLLMYFAVTHSIKNDSEYSLFRSK
jgi:hypothetical protein